MKAIITNALWLMLERVSLSLSGIFVSIYVARYLGPAQFGALNYLLATIAIVVPLVQLGADSIIFNRVARRQPSGIRLMLASIRLRRRLFLVVALPILIWSYFSQTPASQLMTLLLLVSAYFSIQDVYKIYYDARLQSKRNTLINNLALLLSIGLRLALVSAALPLVWFAVPYILSSAVPYLVRLWLFRGEAAALPRVTPRQARRYGHYLLKVGALSGGPGPVVAGVAGPVVVRPPGHCAAVRRRFPTGRQHPGYLYADLAVFGHGDGFVPQHRAVRRLSLYRHQDAVGGCGERGDESAADPALWPDRCGGVYAAGGIHFVLCAEQFIPWRKNYPTAADLFLLPAASCQQIKERAC